MLNKERNFIFEKGNLDDIFPKIYLNQRENLIFIIKKMIEKLRFTEQTYYQALLFMDILLYKQNQNSENNLKILAVSSLILAGILFKLFKNFILSVVNYIFIKKLIL